MSDIIRNDDFNRQSAAPAPKFCMKCGGRLENGICPACDKPAAPAPKFCMKCGSPLNGSAFCANCGTPAKSSAPKAPAQDNAFVLLLKESWDYVKAFFTANPFSAIQNAARSTSHIWAILGTAVCILASLGFFSLLAHEIDGGSMLDLGSMGVNLASILAVIGILMGDPEALYSGGSDFMKLGELLQSNAAIYFIGLLVIVLTFFAFSALLKLFFTITKKNAGWVTVFNIQAAALIPFAVFSAVAALFALFSPILAVILLLFGTLFSYIYLYFGIQKAAKFEKSPFWLYMALVAVHYVAVYLIVTLCIALFC